MSKKWIPVIGLEIHAELNTKSKLFSRSPNRFGDEPNSNITEFCTGEPGALPVLNFAAVEKAVRFGCAVNSTIPEVSKFDRKSYFYPDNPRNFQITQQHDPIILGGTVVTEIDGEEKTFALHSAHLEDDAGMLKHFSTFAGVDFNRAGVPLLEIVSEPCIHSAKEAVAYAKTVKSILEYIDASDCNMEEGSLRLDINVSVMLEGEAQLRNRIEIKNMNSFTFAELAINAEIKRQIQAYESNPNTPIEEVIKQSTYRWDSEKKEAVPMRSKENADDYRYFPEPDLVPIVLKEEYIESIRLSLPELPLEKRQRYEKEFGFSLKIAHQLVDDKKIADYFEGCLKTCSNAKALCNWILIEFTGRLKESRKTLWDLGITPENVGDLVNMIDSKKINGRIAKQVADDMVSNPGKSCKKIVEENPNYQPVNDTSTIEPLVDQVLSENQQSIDDYKAGKQKAFSFLVGQVMKLSRGKASPDVVNQLLKDKMK